MKLRSFAFALVCATVALGGCSIFKKDSPDRVGKFSSKTGSRYNDEDVHDYRTRSDALTRKGKRSGDWVLKCDQMTSNNPATDPSGDLEIGD